MVQNDKLIKKEEGNLFRIDKNFANNPNALALDFGGDEELAMSILMYCAFQRKNKLFDFGLIDPEKFAKTMGFAPKSLTVVHPRPAFLENMSKDQRKKVYREQDEHPEDPAYRVFDSKFENALYLLVSRNITYKQPGKKFVSTDGRSVDSVEIKSVRLLKNFSIIFQKSRRGKKKILYDYELDESFVQNLSLYYIKADVEDFARLRKKGLHKFYLYIKNLRDMAYVAQKPVIEVNFDVLCDIADINSKEPRDNKRRLKEAFAQLVGIIDVTIDFKKKNPTDRWEYQPVLTFNEIKMKIIPSDKADKIGEKVDIFALNFFERIIAAYKNEHGYEICLGDKTALEAIIMNFLKKAKREQVEEWYMQSQLYTFRGTSDKSYRDFECFYNKLPELNWYSEVSSCLRNLFTPSPAQLQENKEESIESLKRKYKIVSVVESFNDPSSLRVLQEAGYTIHKIKGITYSCK